MNRKRINHCLGRPLTQSKAKQFTGRLTKEQVEQAWYFVSPTVDRSLNKVPLDIVIATVWWEAFTMAVDCMINPENS